MIDCPVDLETQYIALELIVTLNNERQKIGDQESGRAAETTQQPNEMGQAGRRNSPEKKSSSRSAVEWALHATDGLARGKCFSGSKLA